MSRSVYNYYVCDDQSVSSDILRAAIHSELDGFSLRVYSKAGDGRIIHDSCARSVGQGVRRFSQTNEHFFDRPGASPGLASALGALFGSLVFLPILYSQGKWLFLGLIFISTLLGAWAGGAFAMNAPGLTIRRKLKRLKSGELLIVSYGSPPAQQGIEHILSRYSVVTTKTESAATGDATTPVPAASPAVATPTGTSSNNASTSAVLADKKVQAVTGGEA